MKGPESANPETNSRSVVARGWREREWRVTATAIRVLYGPMNFPKLTAGMDAQLFECTKTTELYTLFTAYKWKSLCQEKEFVCQTLK